MSASEHSFGMMSGLRTAAVLATMALLGPAPQAQAGKPRHQAPGPEPSTAAVATLKVTTHMVTLQVVVHDSKGHPVTGLTANDFQVTEQVPPKKDQRVQRIAAFQQIQVAALAAADKGAIQMPTGVYSNLVTMQKVAVPPTILLVDGLNSNLAAQIQVRRQMVKLLSSIPQDIPVAVFLMDRNLHLIQNFTTDRMLLKAAVEKTLSAGVPELNPTDVRDDASSLATLVQDNPPPTPPSPPAGGGGGVAPALQQMQNSAISQQVQLLQQFERETFTTQITTRVQITLDAFRAIVRHVAGYPGRKNLLWISSSFPLAIFPDSDFKFAGMGEFQDKFAELANALSDAKIAVYPMDPSGLEAQSFYDASARPPTRNAAVGTATSASVMHESTARDMNQQTMTQLAEQTGGRVCINNNDLADCVKKAVDDGSTYYELAYYPDAASWTGEFHRVTVKTTRPGMRLSFREGYYARPEGGSEPGQDDNKKVQTKLQEAACHDLLTSTSLLVMAESVPPDVAGQVKYFIAIDPSRLNFAPTGNGHRLSLIVAACAFDKSGTPVQYLQQPTEAELSDQQQQAILAQHAFTRTLGFPPAANAVKVRLLVRDNQNGLMGSVDLPFAPPPAPTGATTPSAKDNTSAPPSK